MQDTIWKQIKCLLLKCYNFMLPSPYPQSHCVHVQYQSLLNSGPLLCFVILWSHRFYNIFRPCETVHIKQLLYCSSNVDLGQGRRQDVLWERGVTLFQAKKRAGKSAFYSCGSQRNSSFHLSSRYSAPPLFWSSPVIESVEKAKRGGVGESLEEGVT